MVGNLNVSTLYFKAAYMELLSDISFGCTSIDDETLEVRGRSILRDDVVMKNQTLYLDAGKITGDKRIEGRTEFVGEVSVEAKRPTRSEATSD